MPTLQVAHLREQGANIIIVPLSDEFEYRSVQEQNDARLEIQARAHAAGLAGAVTVVWKHGGRMRFLSPQNQSSFYRSIGLDFIYRNINKEITWN
jgi:hypothetical protein